MANTFSTVQWLSHADEILVLGNEGRITAKGDFNSLSISSTYLRDILDEQKTPDPTPTHTELIKTIENIGASAVSVANNGKDPGTATESEEEKPQSAQKKPVQETSTFWYYVSSMGRKTAWGYAPIVLFQTGFSTAQRESFCSVPSFVILAIADCFKQHCGTSIGLLITKEVRIKV